jgi:hypothetical protein
MGTCLVVYVHEICTQSLHLRDELLGLHYHQVYIEWLLSKFGHIFKNRETEGDVGHEDTIHDIQMQPLGCTAVEPLHVFLEIAEVGTE